MRMTDMADAAPLVCSSYTLGTEVGFAGRIRAAAAAEFDGIGLRAENYWDADLDDAAMLAVAEEHGVRILEVEYLTAWGTADDCDEAQQHKERTVFHMARAFGVRHVNAGLLEKLPLEVMTEAFNGLCERAGPDLTVALEFMPYSGVPDLATAWRIVQGMPNGGRIIERWHRARPGRAGRAGYAEGGPDHRRLALGARRAEGRRPRGSASRADRVGAVVRRA